ncbi:MAG: helix-turn-helix domain-containing protein [Clostridia bacterium]|nr:helix-turn-helix domain-containing protein [Clostridia bacterium]
MDVLDNIDEMIGKLQTFRREYVDVQELIETERYLTVEDVAKALGVSLPTAREYMSRPDFPRLKCGKGYKVSATAFFLYNLQART